MRGSDTGRAARPHLARSLWAAAALCAALSWTTVTRAGGGPENVLVVVNEDSWASQTVANEFLALRKVPAGNVVYLKLNDLTDFMSIDVNTFRTRVLTPVLGAIQDRGLAGQIDYVVYSADLPFRVMVNKDKAGKKFNKVITSGASINGMTYLHRWVLEKQTGDPVTRSVGYLSLNANWYFRRIARKGVRPERVTNDEQKKLAEAGKLLRSGNWAAAEKILRELLDAHPTYASLHYNLACCLARQDKLDEAMAALIEAVDRGWSNRRHLAGDKDLAALSKRKEFQALLKKIEPLAVQVQAPVAFRSRDAWNPAGRTARTGPRQQYMLSTMLAVTSGRGTSVREALDGLRRSATADGTAPKGTVYYMANKDVRSRTRQWGFDAAITKLKELGVKAEVVNGRLPGKKNDVAGLLAGSASFDWRKSGSRILPGAICEHLTSAGGVMSQKAGQTPCTEFIRAGAAGTSGTVVEPYALQQKFPTPFVHYFYARGCSLAEAFYQSLYGPYQLLIVGDPLCRPWAKIPTVTLDGLQDGDVLKGTVVLRPGVRKDTAPRIGRFELFLNGRRQKVCPPGGTFELDTSTLADGWHELRIVAIVGDEIATQGNLVTGFVVGSRGRPLKVTRPRRADVTWGETVEIAASLEGAEKIIFLHNGRELASASGDKAAAKIDTRRLGLGPVEVQAVAQVKAGGRPTLIAARPIALTIGPPAPLPPVEPPKDEPLADGLKLTWGPDKSAIVMNMHGRGALSASGVEKGGEFQLEGYFDAEADDVYQFQVQFHGDLRIEIDGRPLDIGKRRAWRFAPVSLAKGTHYFRATGKVTGSRSIDIRFGGPGAKSLDGARFRHAGNGQ